MKLHTLKLLSMLVVIGVSIYAQSGRKITTKEITAEGLPKDAVVTINTAEVSLQVNVRDTLGRPLVGLQADDFTVYDNGKRYEVQHFSTQSDPVSAVILLDQTGSTFESREPIEQALLSWHSSLPPDSRVAVMQFTDEIVLTHDWESPASTLRRALHPALKKQAQTDLMEALLFAAAKLKNTCGNRVILLLTNGLHSAALGKDDYTLRVLQSAGIALFVLSETESLVKALKQSADKHSSVFLPTIRLIESELTYLTENSGGQIYFPLNERSYGWMLKEIAEDLRGKYVLSYAPDEKSSPNEMHLIHVLVRGGHQAYAKPNDKWAAQQKPQISRHWMKQVVSNQP